MHSQRIPPQRYFEQQNIPKIIPRAAHCVSFFYLREVVMSRNIKKARITRISKVKADRSLEERVTALEKQITDMQAAMSCDLEASKSIIFSIQAAIENNEKAFNETLRELQSRFTVSNHGDAHFKGVIISK